MGQTLLLRPSEDQMMSLRVMLSTLLACLSVCRPAFALDMTGLWHVHYVYSTEEQNVDRTFTQNGSMLMTDDGFSGSIDVSTGVFSMTGTSEELPPCTGFIPTLSGQVDASGTIFGGTQTLAVPLTQFCGEVSLTLTGSRTACGNGIIDPGEECDEASSPVASPSCCTDQCTLKPAGTQCTSVQTISGGPCEAPDVCDGTSATCPDVKQPDGTPCDGAPFEGKPCFVGGTCSAGDCVGLTRLPAGTDCSLPGQTTMCTTRQCDAFGFCSAAANIQNGCHRPATPRSSIAIRAVPGDDTRDNLTWTWAGGSIDPGSFGHPDLGNDYTLCLSDTEAAIPHLLVSAAAPSGPSWHPVASGFNYVNPGLAPDGVETISLRWGTRAKLRIRGIGALLGLPSTLAGVGVPVVVQLKAKDGTCFETDFNTPKVDAPTSFRAKGG